MSFTWYNVVGNLNNQLIRFASDGGKTFTDITFPEGTWGYEDFNNYIHKKLTCYKDKFGKEKYPINLIFNAATFRVTITLDNNYQLDLTKSNFNDLIGYDKKIIKDKTNVGPRVPNLIQETDILNIHCDLINTSLVDGKDTDNIYTSSTSVLQSSYSFTLEPRRVTFNTVNKNIIKEIRMCVTDGKRTVNLHGADVSFLLLLKPISYISYNTNETL